MSEIESNPLEKAAWLAACVSQHRGSRFPVEAVGRLGRVLKKESLFDEQLALRDGVVSEFDLQWFFGPVGWVLEGVKAIKPVPCRGFQKLWRMPDEVRTNVLAQWAEVSHG